MVLKRHIIYANSFGGVNMLQETGICLRCRKNLRDNDTDEYPPVQIPGKGEVCADCYSDFNDGERYMYFRCL